MGEQGCRALACAGWGMLLAARDPRKGEAVAEPLRQKTGGRVTFGPLDVTSPDSIADLVQRLQQDATRLDALVNHARVYSERRGPEGTRHTLG